MIIFALNFEDEVSGIVDHLLHRYYDVAGVFDLVSEVNGVCIPIYSLYVLLSNLDSVVERVSC